MSTARPQSALWRAGDLSATQIDTADSCLRKWAWEKIDRFPRAQNESAALGGEVHEAQLEPWLRDGKPFDLTKKSGQIALAGMHLIPAPGTPHMGVETEFVLHAWGHRIYGRKDIEFTDRPEVWDHKTTKDMKWSKTPEELRSNIQAVIYAADAMVKNGTDYADLRWVYYKTTKPYKATRVELRLLRPELEPTLLRIKDVADTIQLIRDSGLKAADLPPNPTHCDAYGGCPYQAVCNLSTRERMRALMSQQQTDAEKEAFKAKLRAMNGDQAGATGINPPAGGVQSVPQTNGAPVGAQLSPDGLHYLDTTSNSWKPVPPAAPAAPPPPPPAAVAPPPPPPSAAPSGLPAGAQLSPDGLHYLDTAANAWKPVPAAGATPPPPPPPASAPVPPPPPPGASAATPPPPPGTAPPKRGRGRPRKAEQIPASTASGQFKEAIRDFADALEDYADSLPD